MAKKKAASTTASTTASTAASTTSEQTVSATERLARLERWFKRNGIAYDRERISIRTSPSGSYSVVALQDLPEDELGSVLCAIPKDAVLSVRNTGIADILEEAGITGLLGLSIAVMFERSKGAESPWADYLDSLPPHEDIPLFWTKAQLAELKGTSTSRRVASDLKQLREEYNDTILPLVKEHSDVFVVAKSTYDDFAAATSLVTSRAFQVDDYHGNSMVPLADLFNHRTDGEHVHFETNGDVCVHCGSNGDCACEMFDEDGDEEEEDDEDAEWEDEEDEDEQHVGAGKKHSHAHSHADGGCCDHDHGHGHGRGDETEDDDDDDAASCPSELYDEEGDSEDDTMGTDMENDADFIPNTGGDMIEMVVYTPFSKGDEVYNTYGDKSNTDLLNRYGFVEMNNPYTTVTIDIETVTARVAEGMPNPMAIQDRLEYLEGEFQEVMGEVLSRIRAKERLMNGRGGCCGDDECNDGACGDGEKDDGHEEHEHKHEGGCCGPKAKKQTKAKHAHGDDHDDDDEAMIDLDATDEDGHEEEEDDDEEDEGVLGVDTEMIHIAWDGKAPIVTQAILAVLVCSNSLLGEWQADPNAAVEYFTQVYEGVWTDRPSAADAKRGGSAKRGKGKKGGASKAAVVPDRSPTKPRCSSCLDGCVTRRCASSRRSLTRTKRRSPRSQPRFPRRRRRCRQ
ncbi:hypothetical protein BC831DRAFT_43031 [Entophlyctis helioformis]|nr:hypothetical protein BC831DRAFT_43031 [Entophlyctis helioformis]